VRILAIESLLDGSRPPPDHRALELRVRDTGIGMTEAQLGRLFQPFSQADASTTRRYGGTGLGLTISRRLCELMGGSLRAESVPGQGSTFIAEVVIGVDPNSDEEHTRASLATFGRALVVDDMESARQALVGLLEGICERIDVAASGEEALRLTFQASEERQPYDLVLLDWAMPGLDGETTARRMREGGLLHRAARVVIVTGYARSDLKQSLVDIGADAILTKPISRDALELTLRQTVSPARQRRATEAARPHDRTRLQGARVLLVEDNEINRQIAVELLETAGASVTSLEDGAQACHLLEEGPTPAPFDLVLMDLQMPVLDGYEATKRLRAQRRFDALPIVAMTAHAMREELERCLALGMQGRVTKPVDPEQLFAAVEAVRGGRSPTSEPDAHRSDPTADGKAPPLLDRDEGLARTGGSPALYAELLVQLGALARKTVGLVEHGTPAERLLAIHSLRGVAGNLGARALHAAATRLEERLRAGQRFEALESERARFDTALVSTVEELERGQARSAPTVDQVQRAPLVPGALDELRAALGAGEPRAAELVRALGASLEAHLGARRDRFDEALASFDFDEALALLDG
jgi:two-component system sensor histidine kinase/response regulator